MSFIVLLLSLILLFLAALNFLTVRQTPKNRTIEKKISVLIPVRNEAENIQALVNSLAAQSHLKSAEFIFIDDSSTDDTKSLLKKYSGTDSRFATISAKALPDGWLGKPWALQAGLDNARGEYIVTIDADVRLIPTALAQISAALEDYSLDYLSAYPRQIAHSFPERLIQPLLQWSWLTTVPLRLAERFSISSMVVANGQFFIAKASSLKKIDGFQSSQNQVLDDIEIARALLKSGARGTVINGATVATTHMYSSFAEIKSGYGKSLSKAFGGKVGTAIAILFISLTGIAPLLILLSGDPLGLFAFSAILITRFLSAIKSRSPLADSFLHPLSSAVLIYLIAHSWSSRGKIQWKGRTV